MSNQRTTDLVLIQELLRGLDPINEHERKQLLAWIGAAPPSGALTDEKEERLARMLVTPFPRDELSGRIPDKNLIGILFWIEEWRIPVTEIEGSAPLRTMRLALPERGGISRPLLLLDLAVDARMQSDARNELGYVSWISPGAEYRSELYVYSDLCRVWGLRTGQRLWTDYWFDTNVRLPIPDAVLMRARELAREHHGWYVPNDLPPDA